METFDAVMGFLTDVFVMFGIIVGIVAIFVAPLALVWYIKPVRWYVALFLAEYDFVFTTVQESYFKIAVRFGAVRRVLLSKEGHKIDASGKIVELAVGEAPPKELFFGEELPGGLKFLGWPGIDRVYTKKMRFLKKLKR